MDQPVLYEIRVAGHLGEDWSDWLDGLEVTKEPGGETILRGPLADQSALLGVLNKLHALNLTLLLVTCNTQQVKENLR